jgi:hypothetical protein
MNKVEEILEEKIYPVSYQLTTSVNINNSGTLNTQMLEKARRAFIMETVGTWAEELVSSRQDYPKNDIADVTFGIDVVVMKRKDFNILKSYYEQLFEEGAQNVRDEA